MIFIDCLLTFDEKLMSCLLWTPFITSIRVKWTAVIRVIRFSLSAVYQITHRHVTAVKHNFCFSLFKKQQFSVFGFDEIEQSEGKRRERSTTVDRQTNQKIAHVSKCQKPMKISQINYVLIRKYVCSNKLIYVDEDIVYADLFNCINQALAQRRVRVKCTNSVMWM